VAVTVPVLIAFGALTGSFPIMIGLGIVHAEVWPRVPALGFWPVLGISWGLSALISKFKTKKFELFKNPKEKK
jgi:hypothetical protein